jgi:hypothetical protein
MRLRGMITAAVLAAAQLGVVSAQQAVVNSPTRPSPGINLAFDAPHGQLIASGYAVRSAAVPTSGTATVTGTVNLVITINLVSRISSGSQIPCGAIVIGGEVDLSTPVVDGGIDTVSGNAVVDWKAKTATCTLSIPYEWTLVPDASAAEGLLVGFAAASVDHDHDHDVTRRSTIQLGGPLPLPPSGATTTLAFTTSL